MKPGDDVVIVKSEERYHIGVEARVMELSATEVKLWLNSSKVVTYDRTTCLLQVIQTEEERHASYDRKRSAKAVDAFA
jgi:hypothetical protein